MIAETVAGTSVNRSAGGTGCLAMWQCTYSIGSCSERESAGQHLVQCHAEGVATRIDRPIHASGLFRCHVGECSGDERSRRSREAMPKPISHTWPVAQLTSTLAGLMSLWIRPRPWSWPSAAHRPTARRKNCVHSIGLPSSRSRGSPPGSASTSIVRPLCGASARGRTAQAGYPTRPLRSIPVPSC